MNLSSNDGIKLDVQQRFAAHRSGVVNHGSQATSQGSNVKATQQNSGVSFSQILNSKIDGELKFSAHASTRIKSRNIDLTPEIMGKLEKAVAGAANKGSRDSLILMKNLAFIVNIPNRTVITAMDGESMKENVFTNIDSAVIAD
jgi:flagellar operon protein